VTSYFRTKYASSVTNAITLTHNLNPFRDSLRSLQNTVNEIEDVGGEITTQLQSNREQIKKQQDRVQEVNTMSKYADAMAKRMSKWWA